MLYVSQKNFSRVPPQGVRGVVKYLWVVVSPEGGLLDNLE
jgi:hypothetical protein